jgi:hypothetical protein
MAESGMPPTTHFGYLSKIIESVAVENSNKDFDDKYGDIEDAIWQTSIEPTRENILAIVNAGYTDGESLKKKILGMYLPSQIRTVNELLARLNGGDSENNYGDDIVTDTNIIRKYVKSTPQIL